MAYFHWADYTVLGLGLALSLFIGIILFWKKRRDDSMDEYILGSRSMHPAAIAVSLFATTVSGNVLILAPAEVYMFGSIAIFVFLGQLLSAFVTVFFYAPVYHRMKITSAYQVCICCKHSFIL